MRLLKYLLIIRTKNKKTGEFSPVFIFCKHKENRPGRVCFQVGNHTGRSNTITVENARTALGGSYIRCFWVSGLGMDFRHTDCIIYRMRMQ